MKKLKIYDDDTLESMIKNSITNIIKEMAFDYNKFHDLQDISSEIKTLCEAYKIISEKSFKFINMEGLRNGVDK